MTSSRIDHTEAGESPPLPPPVAGSVSPAFARPAAGLPLPPAEGDAPILAIDINRDLANVAAATSNVLLIGSLLALLFSLFPLRLSDSQWQINQMTNLGSNGPWMLLGILLLHLAVQQQPSKGRWLLRLVFVRRLSVLLSLLFLLLVPLQISVAWQGLQSARSANELTLRATLSRVQQLRRAISQARDLPELRQRVRAIEGAPPIPAEADSLPFATVRAALLGQLDGLAGTAQNQSYTRARTANEAEVWRLTLRNTLMNLLLAFGFAGVTRGANSSFPLVGALLALPGAFRRLPRRLRSLGSRESAAAEPGRRRRRRGQGGQRLRRSRPSLPGQDPRSSGSAATAGAPPSASSSAPIAPLRGGEDLPARGSRLRERWERWKRKLRE